MFDFNFWIGFFVGSFSILLVSIAVAMGVIYKMATFNDSFFEKEQK